MENFIKVTPDREMAKNLLETVDIRLDAIELLTKTDAAKFASKITEEYYEAMLEIVNAILSIDGYRTRTDIAGAHISSISYMRRYPEISERDIHLLDDMRKKRSGVKYYGRHVNYGFIKRNENDLKSLIRKLRLIAEKRLDV